MKCVNSSRCHEAAITDMYLTWIYLHGICRWQKRYENTKMNVVRPMDIAEYTYGLKSTIYTVIQNGTQGNAEIRFVVGDQTKEILMQKKKFARIRQVRRKREIRRSLNRLRRILHTPTVLSHLGLKHRVFFLRE